ncbi:UV DNA damage repair endonuclease UvsE [Radiobacillus kanasensis]|uniref:UV DNA damage repair endonuclease UvsE n=1 Tax=Radiobacillus kanasensis TaxID=2844358 RepID=UPI001E652C2A|nr:UV DNA damage repair endonuclease UvsE [Radiobacillus kanasensis]UFU01185.1 UV DNA damage repair endonuclease UvsE [Radiobacillus kanasensis]
MTLFRLGYVSMSVQVENCSPSQTVTWKSFSNISDRDAAIGKVRSVAQSNIENCLRLLKHNNANGIKFFRMSSRIIPLATHEELADWDYKAELTPFFQELGGYARKKGMRVGFHPDHFVVLNTPKKEVLKQSIYNLVYHYNMLAAMGEEPVHKCVLHIGGSYGNKEESLERFIENWAKISPRIQNTVILENDDKTFNVEDVLYLSEKLEVPHVFDLHHHAANHNDSDWTKYWERIVDTWKHSPSPVKIHISSPKSEKQFRAHADYVDSEMFRQFMKEVSGTIPQVDCMIEAKQKDAALFKLVEDLKKDPDIKWHEGAVFETQ